MQITDIVDDLPKHATLKYWTRPLSWVDGLVVHHFANWATIYNVALFHISPRPAAPEGWPGIGYHYCILTDGAIFQVNYHNTISYHVGNPNWKTIGIALQGNYTHPYTPPQAQLDAARWLVNHLSNSTEFEIKLVDGHGTYPGGTASACPGNTHPQWLPYVKTPIESEPIPTPDDVTIELPIGANMIELSPSWLEEPINLVGFTTVTGRGVQVITLNNLPPRAKGVICRLAVRGTDLYNWVSLGGTTQGSARFRLDGRVHSDVSFDINTGMIPLEDNKLYINYDGHNAEVTYYIDLHGYGLEPEPPQFEEGRIELLELKVGNLECQIAQLESVVAVLGSTVVKKNTSVKII